MKKKFTIKRTIILLSIILVYSVALCFISVLARKSILNDVAFNSNSPQVISNAIGTENYSQAENEISTPQYYQPLDMLEDIIKKDQYDNYGIFAPVTTDVEITQLIESDKTEAATTAPDVQTSEPTTPTPYETEPPQTTTVPETTSPETTTSPDDDVIISEEEDESVIIDDAEESVKLDDEEPEISTPGEFFDEEYIQSILEEYYSQLGNNLTSSGSASTPQFFPEDNLVNGKSYHCLLYTSPSPRD